jgi:hypothetical protein
MKMAKNLQNKTNTTAVSLAKLDADELKSMVRDGLVSMNISEREDFISALESEMKSAGIDIRVYLVPLGIPGRSPEDLTPTEVGHLIRFLKINVPSAMSSILRALNRWTVFSQRTTEVGGKIAA